MPIYGDPVTPDPLPVWFNASQNEYGARTAGEKLEGAALITPPVDGGPGGLNSYQAFTEPLEEMPSTWPSDVHAFVQADADPVDPFEPTTTAGNHIRWIVDRFTDGFLDLSESVVAGVRLRRGVPRGWESTYDINLQSGVDWPWTPFWSGIATPPGAIGWEIVGDGEILEQNLTVFHGQTTGYVDDLQIVVAYSDIELSDNGFAGKFHTLYADANTVMVFTPTRSASISGDTGITKSLPTDFRPTSAGTLMSVPTPALLPLAVPEVGIPDWLPGVEDDEINSAPWAWRFEVTDGDERDEAMEYEGQAVFDYLWQPPVFRWIFEGRPFAPPCRGYPRHGDLGNTSARGYPPPKGRQGGFRLNGYY